MTAPRRRFYRDVAVEPVSPNTYAILLDGRSVKTPGGAGLVVPGQALAEAVAEEWRAQVDNIRPETMMLTRLANTAIDRAGENRAAVTEQILAFARSELICYRAEAPGDLVGRQRAAWDPLLAWADERHGIRLITTAGIGFVEQPPESLEALARAIAARDAFALTGLHAAATLLASAIIALAFSEDRLDAETAFEAAHVDEIHQAARWGVDAEAEARSRARAGELALVARFLRLLKADAKS